MSLKRDNQIGANLLGGAISVLLSIPIASLVASLFGDSYTSRSIIYILILGWSVIGALLIGYIGKNSKSISGLKIVIIWIISVWLWPIPLITYLTRNK